jgi:hypothetical protein
MSWLGAIRCAGAVGLQKSLRRRSYRGGAVVTERRLT